MEVVSLGLDPATRTPVVLLTPAEGPALYADRVMPIQIGGYEASALLSGMRGVHASRPGAYDLLAAIIDRSNLELMRVEIYAHEEQTFFARLVFDIEGSENTLEARPSDAMALATRLNAPVFADEHMFVEHSLPKNAVHVHEGPPPPATQPQSSEGDFESALDVTEEDLADIDEDEVMGPLVNALSSLVDMFQASTGMTGIGVDMRVMGMMPQFTPRAQPRHEVNENDVEDFKSFLDNVTPGDFS